MLDDWDMEAGKSQKLEVEKEPMTHRAPEPYAKPLSDLEGV